MSVYPFKNSKWKKKDFFSKKHFFKEKQVPEFNEYSPPSPFVEKNPLFSRPGDYSATQKCFLWKNSTHYFTFSSGKKEKNPKGYVGSFVGSQNQKTNNFTSKSFEKKKIC